MRVTAILYAYPPKWRIGAHLATHEWLAALARRGHDVAVLARFIDRPYRLDGVDVLTVDCADAVIADTDVIVHHAGDEGAAARIAAEFDIPRITLVHGGGDGLDDPVPPVGAIACSTTAARLVSTVAPVRVVNPYTADVTVRRGGMITLVSASKWKGVDTFRSIAEAMPDRQFLIVEGGWGDQIAVDLPNVSTWPTQSDMAWVWASTRILLFPSERECWGMTGVEAMACGIPVIAHPCDGLVESLGSAGIFADRDMTAAWVDLIDALDDPDVYADASARARTRFEALDLSPEPFVDVFEELACPASLFSTGPASRSFSATLT